MAKERMVINGDLCHDILISKITPKLSYDESKDYFAWKEEIRAKLVELLAMDLIEANACPLEITIEEDEMKEGYRQIRFVFESEIGSFVPCYLLIPNTGKKKYPVGIILQGHAEGGMHSSIGEALTEDDKEYIATRGDFAIQCVKEGYAALCIEQRCMGERITSRHVWAQRMCSYPALAAILLGRTTIGERAWDVSRAIDLMPSFEMLDTDKIFITGNSGGGTMSFYAACLDERIKLSAPSCAFCSFEKSLFHKRHCACNFIPGAYRWFEMQDLACLIAPRPFISFNGIDDQIFLVEGARTAMETTKKFYEKEGVPNNCELVVTPKGHYWCKDLVWPKIREYAEKLGWFDEK